jgi:hypothetical protein
MHGYKVESIKQLSVFGTMEQGALLDSALDFPINISSKVVNYIEMAKGKFLLHL